VCGIAVGKVGNGWQWLAMLAMSVPDKAPAVQPSGEYAHHNNKAPFYPQFSYFKYSFLLMLLLSVAGLNLKHCFAHFEVAVRLKPCLVIFTVATPRILLP
jgi:hypothetical protein